MKRPRRDQMALGMPDSASTDPRKIIMARNQKYQKRREGRREGIGLTVSRKPLRMAEGKGTSSMHQETKEDQVARETPHCSKRRGSSI